MQTLWQAGDLCMLHKKLPDPIYDREGYISRHAISLVLSGEQRIRTFDDELIRVQAGQLAIISRGLYFVSDLLSGKKPFESLLFYFDTTSVQQFLAKATVTEAHPQRSPGHLVLPTSVAVSQLAQQLFRLGQDSPDLPDSYLEVKIQELLLLIYAQSSAQVLTDLFMRMAVPRRRQLRPFMEQHALKPLKVTDYAYLTGRSESTFRRDFKSQFRESPQQWLREQRLNRAAELLQTGRHSVTEVAQLIGYDNTSYFIRAFRQKEGQTPRQYAQLFKSTK